jgi:hypothetical protein
LAELSPFSLLFLSAEVEKMHRDFIARAANRSGASWRNRARLVSILAGATATAIGIANPRLCAADTTASWVSASGTWTTPTDWSSNPFYPNAGNPSGSAYQAIIAKTGSYTVSLPTSTVTLDGLTLNAGSATLAETSGTLSTGSFNLSAGTFLMNGGTVGFTALTQSSGSFLMKGGDLIPGSLTLTSGNFLMSGGTIASGLVAITGGTFSMTSGTAAPGTLNLSNGTLLLGGGTLDPATLNVSGGSLLMSAGLLAPSKLNLTAGTIVMNGGTASPTGTFTLQGGDFQLNAGTVTAGAFNLSSGTLLMNAGALSGGVAGATVNLGSAHLLFAGADTLDHLTFIGGNVTDALTGGTLTLTRGLSLNGASLNLTGTSQFLYLDGVGETLDNLTINADSPVYQQPLTVNVGGPASSGAVTDTLGAHATLLGQANIYAYNGAASTLASAGTIDANLSNQMLIDSVNTTNSGTLEATSGGRLILANTWSNSGTIIVGNNSIVALGGTFSPPNIGTLINNSGGTVNLTGTLVNTGATLALGGTTGNWALAGGTIAGGTVSLPTSTSLTILQGTLVDPHFTGADLALNNAQAVLDVINGLTIDSGNFDINAPGARVYFDSNQTLNNLAINANASQDNFPTSIYVGGFGYSGATTLTLSNTCALNGSAYINTYNRNGTLVSNGAINATGSGLSFDGALSVINNGTMTAGAVAPLSLLGPLTNSGIIAGGNGATLTIGGSTLSTDTANWTNSGTISAPPGATIWLLGNATNSGTISAASGSTLNLLANLANVGAGTLYTNGTLNLLGTLNTSGLLALNATGAVNFGGTINGGTIALPAGQTVNVTGGTLNGTNITGANLVMNSDDVTLTISNGLTLGGHSIAVNVNDADLYFNTTQTVDQANISINPGSYNYFTSVEVGWIGSSGSVTLTLGPSASLSGAAIVKSLFTGSGVINNGTINANASGGTLDFDSSVGLVNNGTVAASSGGILTVGGSFTNTGTVHLAGGTITTAGSLPIGTGTLAGSGDIEGDLDLSNAAATLAMNIGGRDQSIDYDSINIDGNVTLGGNLSLAFTNGFGASVNSSDVFVLMTLGDSGTFTGSFADVASGSTLEVAGNLGSFEVLYANSGPDAGELLIENFQPNPAVQIPEPTSIGLLGAIGLLALRRRRIPA